MLGWLMYSTDNTDYLIPNGTAGGRWAGGSMDWLANSANTNTDILTDPTQSLIAQYVKSPKVWKCCSDTYQSAANPGPRVRSLSMNAALGGNADTASQQIPGRTYFSARKQAQLVKPGPSMTWVTLDEHPDSINDAIFYLIEGRLKTQAEWRDLPASYHWGGGCNFSFADGHSDIKKWLDPDTKQPVKYIDMPNFSDRDNVDYVWMNDRVPYTEP